MSRTLLLPHVRAQDLVCRHRQEFEATARPLAFLRRAGDRIVVARGGRSGAGNARRASRAYGPASSWSEAGGTPEATSLLLERKLLADVALVGFPNAGKSSLLRALTRAQPRVAPYAFTTLQPQLGALAAPRAGESGALLADLPGLVQGAHKDRGLGLDFLKCASAHLLLPSASRKRGCCSPHNACQTRRVRACVSSLAVQS